MTKTRIKMIKNFLLDSKNLHFNNQTIRQDNDILLNEAEMELINNIYVNISKSLNLVQYIKDNYVGDDRSIDTKGLWMEFSTCLTSVENYYRNGIYQELTDILELDVLLRKTK